MLSPFTPPVGLSDASEGAPVGISHVNCGPIGGAWDGFSRYSGREAALILIEEHLTDSPIHAGYRPIECGNGPLMNGWNVPFDWAGPHEDGNFVLKVQRFAQGGHESVVRRVDMPKIGRAILGENRPRGKRVIPDEPSIDCRAKSAARAKRKSRQLCRNMMATHMLTLNKAEGPNIKMWGPDQWGGWGNGGREDWEEEHGAFWTEAQWADAWDSFRRQVVRVIGYFPYLGILEEHKKGNFHLHVAWAGRIQLGIVRKIWYSIVGGRFGGEVNAKEFKVPHGHDRSAKIAAYMSKYVSKSFLEDSRFNKKRYWASKQTMEECKRYVLSSLTLDGAKAEVARLLGLDYAKFLVSKNGEFVFQNLFFFPDGDGVWINYIPGVHDPDPPF